MERLTEDLRTAARATIRYNSPGLALSIAAAHFVDFPHLILDCVQRAGVTLSISRTHARGAEDEQRNTIRLACHSRRHTLLAAAVAAAAQLLCLGPS